MKFFIRTRQFVNDSQILEDIQKIKALMPDGLLILNIGYLNYLNSNEFSILLNYNLNIFNSYSFNELRNHNLNAILSVELNFDEMTQIKDKNYFVFIHGQLPVSYIKADVPVGYIEDEKHFMFKIEEYPSNLNNNERNITKNNDKYKILFNSKELGFFENVKKLNENGIKNYFIDTRRNISSVVKYYREILFGKSVQNNFYYNKKEFTTGHLKRGVE